MKLNINWKIIALRYVMPLALFVFLFNIFLPEIFIYSVWGGGIINKGLQMNIIGILSKFEPNVSIQYVSLYKSRSDEERDVFYRIVAKGNRLRERAADSVQDYLNYLEFKKDFRQYLLSQYYKDSLSYIGSGFILLMVSVTGVIFYNKIKVVYLPVTAPGRPRISLKSKKSGKRQSIEDYLWGILEANSEVPASIDFHDVNDGGLLKHTSEAYRKGITLYNEKYGEMPPEVFRIALIAHDIGKLYSYYRENGEWKRRDNLHAQNSAAILNSMSEFWNLNDVDRISVLLSVKNHHTPESLPVNAPELSRKLLQFLSEVDGRAVKESVIVDLSEPAKKAREMIPAILGKLNINGYLGGQLHGWFNKHDDKELLFVKEYELRKLFQAYLPPELSNILKFNLPQQKEGFHPAFDILKEILEEILLLNPDSPSGCWDIKAGAKEFDTLLRLDPANIDEGLRQKWMDVKTKYTITVKNAPEVKTEMEPVLAAEQETVS
jgi:CRISPR/Cas system-associated endonuclease Cas3-HD